MTTDDHAGEQADPTPAEHAEVATDDHPDEYADPTRQRTRYIPPGRPHPYPYPLPPAQRAEYVASMARFAGADPAHLWPAAAADYPDYCICCVGQLRRYVPDYEGWLPEPIEILEAIGVPRGIFWRPSGRLIAVYSCLRCGLGWTCSWAPGGVAAA